MTGSAENRNGRFAKSRTDFDTEFGRFDLFAYEMADGGEHLALVTGNPAAEPTPLVRIQSSCLTGTAFHARLCDCRQQLHASLELIASCGSGCVIYLDQEGRGHGLVEKVEHLAAIRAGSDTVDAALDRGMAPDIREYSAAREILEDLLVELAPIRLLTNCPQKIAGLEDAGVAIAERLPLEVEPTDGNREYLRVKKQRMGHLLTRV